MADNQVKKDMQLNEEELNEVAGGNHLYHSKTGQVLVTPMTPACANYNSNSYLPVKVCSTCSHMSENKAYFVCTNPMK